MRSIHQPGAFPIDHHPDLENKTAFKILSGCFKNGFGKRHLIEGGLGCRQNIYPVQFCQMAANCHQNMLWYTRPDLNLHRILTALNVLSVPLLAKNQVPVDTWF
jgi:hypothetical protein